MPKPIRKGDLPQKPCQGCGRPFAWRKKWARVWDEVKYCSERCRRERKPPTGSGSDSRRDIGPAEVVSDK